jgi:hypothetical protein
MMARLLFLVKLGLLVFGIFGGLAISKILFLLILVAFFIPTVRDYVRST